MISKPVKGTYYRLHSPKWAHEPASGAGAAKHGGRLNRPGVQALYLAADVQTAVAEFQQQSSLLAPGTLVSYSVSLSNVVDFSQGYEPAAWDPIWQDFFCEWRKLALNQIEPPSWVISDLVQGTAFQGVLFPSSAHHGGINLVVYPARLTASDKLAPIDPRGDLPKDQSSWRTSPP